MIRTAWVALVAAVATAVFGTFNLVVALFTKGPQWSHLAGKWWARCILFAAGVRVTIHGASAIGSGQSYIIMANHQSNFDIPVLMAHLPLSFRWLAKAELFRIPVFGFLMRRAGHISIDRSKKVAAYRSLKAAAETISRGVSVVVFPEGTRSEDGNIKPFKSGGFLLAVEAGVPILPVILSGSRSIMEKGSLRIVAGQVAARVLPPVETQGYTRRTREALQEKIRCVMCESFDRFGERVS